MATSRINDSEPSSRTAKNRPPRIMIGAVMNKVSDINTKTCTWVTSLVIRVISDGAPNWPTSRAEYSMTVWNRSCRTSRPKPMAERAPKNVATIANTTCTKETASMMAPTFQMYSVSPVERAVVDDVGVERRQDQRGRRLQGLEHEDEDEPPAVRAQVVAGEPDQHGASSASPRRRMPSSSAATISADVSGASAPNAGWTHANVRPRRTRAASAGALERRSASDSKIAVSAGRSALRPGEMARRVPDAALNTWNTESTR